MKYKSGYVNDSIFYQDIKKIFSFIDTWGNETKHYFAFVQEKYFKKNEIINWIDGNQAIKAKGMVTELYAFWDEDRDETVWTILRLHRKFHF